MPTITRWFIKSGLLYLAAALSVGIADELEVLPVQFTPVYIHMFMVGWVTQLIFGVSYWMFPRITRENPRGNERLAWICFWLLNAGLIIRIVVEPTMVITKMPGLLVISAILQWLSGMTYITIVWPRIKEKVGAQT